MNLEKYIIINGNYENEIINAIQQYSNNYSDTGFTQNIELYKSKNNSNIYIVNFSNKLDFERFKYFINFLKYPFDIKYNIDVKGYWTISENDKIKNNHINHRGMFYISPNDNEYDNVFGIFKGQDKPMKFDFASDHEYEIQKIKEIDFNETEIVSEDFDKIKVINPDPTVQNKRGKGCLLTLTLFVLIVAGLTLII